MLKWVGGILFSVNGFILLMACMYVCMYVCISMVIFSQSVHLGTYDIYIIYVVRSQLDICMHACMRIWVGPSTNWNSFKIRTDPTKNNTHLCPAINILARLTRKS